MNKPSEVVEQKVLNRIRKMLSMAHGTAEGGEHERDTAMKHVMTLLAKHNLSMHDFKGDHGVQEEGRITEQVIFRDEPWSRSIVSAIAKLFFCVVYTQRRNKDVQFVFVGRESNVATAKEMSSYLIDSVAKESRKVTTREGSGSSAFKTSFRKGAAARISQRATQMRLDAERESEVTKVTGTSLVLASVYKTEELANDKMLEQLGVNLVTAKTRTTRSVNVAGFSHGVQFGGKVGLNKQVD